MLSSRWEGLTGYWVSRLEGNRQELSHLPLEQEMSRQITDLAAAGANLFQALIELQRLRASSERKFQRWFFETRADQERAREMSSELERTLRIERQKRADAMTAMQQCEKDKATAEKLAQEAQRELQISKEECRRAWEELGRREQEERERINQLREGHPTLIGGVQVIAMPMPGVPSRSGSTAARPRTATGAGPTSSAATFAPQTSQQQGDYDTQQSVVSQTGSASPTQSRTRQQQGDYNTSTTPTPASPSSSFYQQQPPNIHDRLDPRGASGAPPANPSPVSYITNPMGSPTISAVSGISDAFETDEHGNVVTDGNGNPIYAQRSRRHQESDRRQRAREQEEEERQWGNYPSYEGEEWGTTAGGPIGDAPEAASSGTSGYGRNGGGATDQGGVPVLQQEAVWAVGSHHHPTRLSNIEEERETASEIGTR